MKKLITVLLLYFSILGCSKDKEPTTTETFSFDPEGLKYVQFRPGQYFIYKDSATGQEDSVVVTDAILDYVNGQISGWWGVTGNSRKQHYSFTMTRKSPGPDSIWLNGSAVVDSYDFVVVRVDDADLLGTIFCYMDMERSPFMKKIQERTVAGRSYTNVLLLENSLFTDTKTHQEAYRRSFYWANSVGLIEMQTVKNNAVQTYYLTRYK